MCRDACGRDLDLVLQQAMRCRRRRSGNRADRMTHAPPARIRAVQQTIESRLRALLHARFAQRRSREQRRFAHIRLLIHEHRALPGRFSVDGSPAELARQRAHHRASGFTESLLTGHHPCLREKTGERRTHESRRILTGVRGCRIEHEIQRAPRDRQHGGVARPGVLREQQRDRRRMHHAARRSTRANGIVELAPHLPDGCLDQPQAQDAAGPAVSREHELSHQGGVLYDDGTLLAITARDFRQQLFQASPRDGIVRGEIRAAEEGRTVGCEKNGEWPAVQARETLDGRLIALRDVRPLVAIHADRNEEHVDQRTDLGIGVDRAIGFGTPATRFAADV